MNGALRRVGVAVGAGLVMLWLAAPMLIVLPMSFTAQASFKFPPESWSTRWYTNLFTDPVWVEALTSSLKIAVAVMALSTVLGSLAAFALVRGRFRLKAPINALLVAPMIVPTVITGVAVYAVFLEWRLTGTTLGFILAHTTLAVPFVVVTVSASLRTFDERLELAASSLGAAPLTRFRLVTLPLIAPGLVAGALFALATSFDELVVALFVSTPEVRTLPVQMYSSVTRNVDPTVAAASSVLLVSTIALLVLVAFAARLRKVRLGES